MLKPDDIVICHVTKIEGTTVFVDIEGHGHGALMMSEIAAGRIRNLRDYVAVNRKIVCKVLKVQDGNIQLSLRRVTGKEREEVLEKAKKEKTFSAILKTGSPDYEKIISEIKKDHSLADFFEKARSDTKILDKYMKKEEAQKIAKILAEKHSKEKIAKVIVILKSDSPNGVSQIKEVLNTKTGQIKYLGSSKFLIETKAQDFKEANHTLDKITKEIEAKAKEKKIHFEIRVG